MSDPQAIVMDLIYGRWRSQTLYAGVKLGIFDVIKDEPMAANEIARQLGLDSALSYRLLRALGSLELLKEHSDRNFSITSAGELLRSDHPQTLCGVTLLREGPEHYAVWKHLPAIVRDGVQDGFTREYGLPAFDYAMQTPEYAEAFDKAMSSYSMAQTAWVLEALQTYDFSKFSHICDVGGGQGHLLCHCLAQHPHLSGTVFERPSVLKNEAELWAQRLHVGDRCEYIGGDMFLEVPPADAYFLKMILHNWNDEECVQILRTLSKRATSSGRVFIVEHVIPDIDTPHFSKLFDIHMMCWGTGRERTAQEFASLLQNAGWKYMSSWFPQKGTIGVLEGVKLSEKG